MVDDREEVVITRAGHEPVVIVALDDYESLKETAYLLRSPENARRLLASIDRLEHEGGTEQDLWIEAGLGRVRVGGLCLVAGSRPQGSQADQRADRDIERSDNDGIGKPEPLKHGFRGTGRAALPTSTALSTRSSRAKSGSPPAGTTTSADAGLAGVSSLEGGVDRRHCVPWGRRPGGLDVIVCRRGQPATRTAHADARTPAGSSQSGSRGAWCRRGRSQPSPEMAVRAARPLPPSPRLRRR